MAIVPFIEVKQRHREFLLTSLPVGVLTTIAYASTRGVDSEEGAVQRLLNPRRVASIKKFTLEVGDYPTSVVLNWVDVEHPLKRNGNTIEIPEISRAAQLIDGQHRVAGLRAAMEDDPSIENLEIPVAIFENLNTTDCASIFLSINTQQKPVPSSLVYDLYGVADESVVDPAATRARDIAIALNEDEDSPYYEQIKLPGSPRRKGGIALSTAATAIKPLVEPKGDFEQRGITQFETQKQVIKNLFSALSEHYGEGWYETTNAFMYAAGFTGAIDFLRTKLLSYGHTHKSYTQQTFFDAIRMQRNDLILQQEVKGKGGKDAPAIILDRLNGMFAPKEGSAEAFEV
jgi:DGQHR domain-containing protein